MHFDEIPAELFVGTGDGAEHGYASMDGHVDDPTHAGTDDESHPVDTDDDGHPVDTDDDSHPVGDAIDSDGDGVADTVVAHTSDGATVLVTDTTGDGAPDAFTTVTAAGDYSSYALASDGAWAETGHGGLADGHPPTTSTDRPAVIDPQTGQWVRR